MQLSDHSLRQIDEAYLERLGDEALRALSAKLLLDLKEARERLNQTSRNSSLPPSREAPWEKTRPADATAGRDEDPEETVAADMAPEAAADPTLEAGPAPAMETKPMARKRAGKAEGARGYGRPAPERIDALEPHRPAACAGCGAGLAGQTGRAYTGYYEADWVREGLGWAVRITKHLFEESLCECGHVTRAEPVRSLEDGVEIGGFRLIGPGLASLMVALSKRYGMSRARIQEFLHDWLDVRISTGAIHEALAETAAIVAPLEQELVRAIQQSELLHADETPWPEQGASSLWLWVFVTGHAVLYYVSHRGQELVRNLLEGFAGVLVSDGWQAYRWVERRLRCWAHLKRKAQGLADSLDPAAQGFGREVLALWDDLREAVQNAREGPPGVALRPAWEGRLRAFRARCEAMRGHSHAKTHALAAEFLNDWEAVFCVLENPFWPLTNNEAERALRHWVILRQISHGTRTPQGSRHFALLASVIDTCRRRGHSPWEYLRTAITRRRQGLALLPLPV
jgi:transposase